MSKTDLPSRKKTSARKKVTSRKRRRDQNDQIDELSSLVPLATPLLPSDTSLVPARYCSVSTSSTGIDKISVLRLTASFLKLKGFMKETTPSGDGDNTFTNSLLGLMEEAIGGFMIVLDKDADILYVSETVESHVGLTQTELIGQNLVDVAHPDSAAEIRDNLKPSVLSSVSIPDDCTYIISQYRQFCVRLQATASHLRVLPHTMVRISGNLKVKLPPLKNVDQGKKIVVLEPLAMGFVGECHVLQSARLLLELSLPHSTFTSTVTLNFKPLSVEATVREIVGYEPEELLGDDLEDDDFIHPADLKSVIPSKQFLVETGHALTPHFRFLAKSGDWVWMQVEGTVHCKQGTSNPQFYEYKARVLSQGGGRLRYIEQKELYASKISPLRTVA